jgi:hypothetical protein
MSIRSLMLKSVVLSVGGFMYDLVEWEKEHGILSGNSVRLHMNLIDKCSKHGENRPCVFCASKQFEDSDGDALDENETERFLP